MLPAGIIAGLRNNRLIDEFSTINYPRGPEAGGPSVTIDPTQPPLPVQGFLGITGTLNVTVTNPATAPALPRSRAYTGHFKVCFATP